MTSVACAFWNAVPDTVRTTEEAHVRSIVTRTLGAAALAAAAIGLAACGSSGSGSDAAHRAAGQPGAPTRSADGCLLPDANLTLDEMTKKSHAENGEPPVNGGWGAGAEKLWAAIPSGGKVKAVEFVCPELTGPQAKERPYSELNLAFSACVAASPEPGVSPNPAGGEAFKRIYKDNENKPAAQMVAPEAQVVAAGKFLCPQIFR